MHETIFEGNIDILTFDSDAKKVKNPSRFGAGGLPQFKENGRSDSFMCCNAHKVVPARPRVQNDVRSEGVAGKLAEIKIHF